MAKLVFLDTEFTSLLSPELLSVGLATIDGDELYAELDLVDSAFGRERLANTEPNVRYEVVERQFGLFPHAICEDETAIGHRVGDWLMRVAQSSASGRVELLYDYNIDCELVTDAMRQADNWSSVQAVSSHRNIAVQVGGVGPRFAAEACLRSLRARQPALARHHALADALALRASWQAWHLAHERATDLRRLREALGIDAGYDERRLFDWLCLPNSRFGGRAPLDFVDVAGGIDQIESELKMVASGGTP